MYVHKSARGCLCFCTHRWRWVPPLNRKLIKNQPACQQTMTSKPSREATTVKRFKKIKMIKFLTNLLSNFCVVFITDHVKWLFFCACFCDLNWWLMLDPTMSIRNIRKERNPFASTMSQLERDAANHNLTKQADWHLRLDWGGKCDPEALLALCEANRGFVFFVFFFLCRINVTTVRLHRASYRNKTPAASLAAHKPATAQLPSPHFKPHSSIFRKN